MKRVWWVLLAILILAVQGGPSFAQETGTTPRPEPGASVSGSHPRPGLPEEKVDAPSAQVTVGPRSAAMDAPAPTPPGGPQKVNVGIFLQNVNDIDVKASLFTLDFYIWFRWFGEIDPAPSFEFTNLVERWGLTKEQTYEEPERLPDGSRYQIFHIQGKFNRKFDLHSYPLDSQVLPIEVEDTRWQSDRLIYVADTQATKFEPGLTIPGWNIDGDSIMSDIHRYPTDFGVRQGFAPGGASGAPLLQDPGPMGASGTAAAGHPPRDLRESYARVTYALRISRPWGPYLFRLAVPLLVVISASFVVFLLAPVYIDARLSISITALLTAVALHLTVSADLPQVGYIRLIDKLYNLAYAMIFVTLIESVAVIRMRDAGREEEAKRLDRILGWVLPFLTVAGMIVLIALR